MNVLTCNGQPADTAALAAALVNYGHFTSMQVRDSAVQGLDLHLARLQTGTGTLFGSRLDTRAVTRWILAALAQAGTADASVRVTVFSQQFDFRNPLAAIAVDVLVAVSPPVALTAPRRVISVSSQREMPALKHVGTFGLFAQRRAAMAAGADDALLLDVDGHVSEGTTWNLAVHDGDQLIWPRAAALRGVTEALVQAHWDGPQIVRPLPVAALKDMVGAFACNASGLWSLEAIDGYALSASATLAEQGRAALARAAWHPLGADEPDQGWRAPAVPL